MPARTGEQFLKGLRGPREIWVDGERVSDVVDHPKLRGAAHALAEVFDLQHNQADICLTPDPETGEPIAVSHVPPRSRADLQRRHKALRAVSEYSVGLMGRTPDYMNVTYAGFAGSPVEWGGNGNEAGYERLVAYQKFLRRNDISLTHTIVQPTVDKATGDRVGSPPGSIDRDKVPSTTQTLTAEDFTRSASPNITETLLQRVPSIAVSDPNGNGAQQEIKYRGFYASPTQGTPQGIAVYMNGIRLLKEAKKAGMKTMIGCMVETTLGISSALHLCSLADYADLDSWLVVNNEPFNLISENKGGLTLLS